MHERFWVLLYLYWLTVSGTLNVLCSYSKMDAQWHHCHCVCMSAVRGLAVCVCVYCGAYVCVYVYASLYSQHSPVENLIFNSEKNRVTTLCGVSHIPHLNA